MSNILVAIASLVENPQTKLTRFYAGSNRANNMGDALEAYIKDLFASSFEKNEEYANEAHCKVFSYLGNKNNPPDIILKNGDAIEVKKIESKGSTIALNSSYPKAKLYRDSTLLIDSCKSVDGGQWDKKDIVYIIGIVGEGNSSETKDTLKGLWFIYGDCYAASREIYERISNKIISGIQEIASIDFGDTNELARVNKVDPLGITYLRVRGMWGIKNPLHVFSYLNLDVSKDFFAHVIMRKEKFNSFPENDQRKISQLEADFSTSKNGDSFFKVEKNLKNPDNPAEIIEAVILSYTK